MKIVLGIVLICLSTLLGYIMSGKFSLRKEFYNDFYNFNNKLKQEISFKQTTITNIIKNNDESDFYLVLNNYIKNNSFDFDKQYLSKDEIEYLHNYLKILGTGDKQSQLEFLGKANESIMEKQKESTENEKKYIVLYIKLGFLIGLVLFVLVL